ncbi:unnamed protein product [Durusdinium trenchii]|uniref:U-box domain-containing protein n=1 Tax=Durusdinium trenchii TaxID=1381693 RepID=A0ABP0JI30_9DINO
MGRGKENTSEPQSLEKEEKLGGLSRQDSQKILRLSQKGMPVDAIAEVWSVEATEVVKILESMQSSSGEDSQSRTEEGGEHGLNPLVKRLKEEPTDLCCPISHALMEDPVVAADGFTYERTCILQWFKSSNRSATTGQPLETQALHPNQHMKSAIVEYKQKSVAEILSVASQLPSQDAVELLLKGEEFVRPCLPDVSAKKKLVSLLVLRSKLPGITRAEVLKELVPLILEIKDTASLQELLVGMTEPEALSLLSQVDEEMVKSLHLPGPHPDVVSKELVRRMASSWVTDHQDESLDCLWNFLCQHIHFLSQHQGHQHDTWLEAAALVLATHHSRLSAQLDEVDSILLRQACLCLSNQEETISFARDFFNTDLGISTLDCWPPKSSTSILAELASRLDVSKHEEKLELLLEAHGIDDTNVHVRCSLMQQLDQHVLVQDGAEGKDMEGLLLKLHLETKEVIPAEVMRKLSLLKRYLKGLTADELLLLAKMVAKANRQADGARVAVAASELFAANGRADESQDAVVFLWDLLRQDVQDEEDGCADGASLVLATFNGSLRAQLEELDTRLLRKACFYLDNQGAALGCARGFFNSDLGIDSLDQWPPKSSALIFTELASRLNDDEREEKLNLLMKAHGIEASHAHVRDALLKQLCQAMLLQDASVDSNNDSEGLLLRLHLEKNEDIPGDVMQLLSLQERHLKDLAADQLRLLASMLDKANRRADGARVAVAAAELCAANGLEDESHEAIACAHYLDRTNDRASLLLCKLLGSITGKCKGLRDLVDVECKRLDGRCDGLDRRCEGLGGRCDGLDEKCEKLEKPREVPIKSLKWDLSSYNLGGFAEGQTVESEKFPLGVSTVQAWLRVTKKSFGSHYLFLCVTEPVWVNFKVNPVVRQTQYEYAFTEPSEATMIAWINADAASITFELLAVRLPGASLELVMSKS